MSRVVPTRALASFTTDSRHCTRRARSSWKARTPVSDLRSMYSIDSAISLRAAALIDSASLVSRGSFEQPVEDTAVREGEGAQHRCDRLSALSQPTRALCVGGRLIDPPWPDAVLDAEK
jgi:hypothetical protein